MTVPPYACAFVLMFITSYSSDRRKERGLHISALSLVSAVCYIVMANLPDDAFNAKYGLIVSHFLGYQPILNIELLTLGTVLINSLCLFNLPTKPCMGCK